MMKTNRKLKKLSFKCTRIKWNKNAKWKSNKRKNLVWKKKKMNQKEELVNNY